MPGNLIYLFEIKEVSAFEARQKLDMGYKYLARRASQTFRISTSPLNYAALVSYQPYFSGDKAISFLPREVFKFAVGSVRIPNARSGFRGE